MHMQTQSVQALNRPAPQNANHDFVARPISMSSLELVDFINSQREEGEAVLDHADLMKKVPKVLKKDAGRFSDIYLDSMNRRQKCYRFPKREACLMAMSYSYELQAKVFDRMTALEESARAQFVPNNSKIVGELAILECFDRLLKPAPSSKMLMLAKIAQSNGLDANFLPGYAVDDSPDATGGSSMPTKSATALLKDNGIRMSPAVFNKALQQAGYLKVLQRKNSKQEVVDFWSITEKGLRYGKNLTSPQSPRETQPHWYVDRFLELAGLVGVGRK
ncbi:hypothetical protein D9M72_14810 [compost metagenome]